MTIRLYIYCQSQSCRQTKGRDNPELEIDKNLLKNFDEISFFQVCIQKMGRLSYQSGENGHLSKSQFKFTETWFPDESTEIDFHRNDADL